MWLDVALRGVHLRLPWLYVAWRRLVSLHVGSPLGSHSSLAPLMFGDPATPPCRADGGLWPAVVPMRARLPDGSDGDEVDVDPGDLGQGVQVARIGGEDVIAVGRQARHCGIDRVRLAAVAQQRPGPPTRAIIDRHQIGPGQPPTQRRLPASAAAQGLGHDSPARHRYPPRQTFPPDQRHNVTIPALCRSERPGVQHQRHAAAPLRRRAAAELAGMGRRSPGPSAGRWHTASQQASRKRP